MTSDHDQPGQENSVCPLCGTRFRCGAAAGADTCWCSSFPPVVSPDPGTSCYCPRCLPEVIARHTGPSEVAD